MTKHLEQYPKEDHGIFKKDIDPDVYLISDSLINKREADATKEFLESDYDLHIMRDNACHKYNILGGMWSARNGGLRKYKHMLDNFNAISDVRGADQKFMKKILSYSISNGTYRVILCSNVSFLFFKHILCIRHVGQQHLPHSIYWRGLYARKT